MLDVGSCMIFVMNGDMREEQKGKLEFSFRKIHLDFIHENDRDEFFRSLMGRQ